MNKETIQLNSPIEISGLNDDKPYIEMTTRLCWLDAANLNGVGLSSAAEESFKTLIGMPVVAKINSAGTEFGSHEVSIDDKGEIKFNTSAYGVHTDVWVSEDEIELPNVGLTKIPCLFATSKIWKRFPNVVELIANKLENPDDFNGGLWSSWELQGSEYHLNDNKEKIYDKFSFISNCLIDVPPAYSTASKTLLVASKDFEAELCSAYLDDLSNVEETEKSSEALNKNNVINEIKEEIKMPKDTNVSALTTRDLYQKIHSAMNPKGWNSNPYYSVVSVYPEDHKVIAYDIERESEDEFVSATYSVTGDEVSIGETVKTQMSKMLSEKSNVNITLDLNETAKLLSEKDSEIKILVSEKEALATQLSEKVEALLTASEKVEQLQASVDELTPFKEQAEEIQRVEKEAELAQKKEELKKTALKGGFISEAEMETSEEIKSLIEQLDVAGIKSLIADRFIKKLEETDNIATSTATKEVTLSTKKIIDTDEGTVSHKAIMSSFFQNN